MSKITTQRKLRKFAGANISTKRHIEFAEYNGEKFPVLMSPGQVVNIKKAYNKYKQNVSNTRTTVTDNIKLSVN